MSLRPSHDDYGGNPAYPAPWTTKNPRQALRDTDEARIVSLSPDVCLTPLGSSEVPVPYPVIDYCGHDDSYASSVFFSGQKAMILRSKTTHVHGDAPGTAKGVCSATVEGICEPIGHADEVRAEGSHVIRHLDRFRMNNGNTEGEAIFVKGTATYDPPQDNDLVPGSLRYAGLNSPRLGQPVQLAFDGSSPEAQRLIRQYMIEAAKKAPAVLEEAGTAALRRFGLYGAAIVGAYELGQAENQRAWDNPVDYMTKEAERFGGVKSFDGTQFDFFDEAVKDLKEGVPQGFVRDDFYRKMENYRRELQLEELEPPPEKEPEQKPLPLPPPGPGSNARVDEDPGRACRVEVICFEPKKPTIDLKEFERQMELQEAGLNKMTPQQMLANRAAYLADPVGMRALSKPLQDKARNEYRTTEYIRDMYNAKYGYAEGSAKLEEYLKAAAALHNPDMAAGGAFNSVVDNSLPVEDRVGGLVENSSMGSQWINPNRGGNTRASRLTRHAEQQAKNNCPSVMVDLRLCPSDPLEPGKPLTP